MSHSDLAIVMRSASTHHGVISADQLHRAGFTRSRIRRLVTTGVLRRVVDGAYRLTSAPATELVRCAAVSLARPGLIVSGPTAARIQGFRRVPNDGIVHVTSKPHAQPARAEWVRSYRTALLADCDILTRPDGIRLTTRPRTVVDMVRYASDSAVVSMIEQGLDEKWFTERRLRRTAEFTASPGRPFARHFLDLLADRLGGGPAGSDWEAVVGEHLRLHGITGVVRQLPLDVPGYGSLRFDLAVPERRWALEIDVHPEHFSREGAARDKFRDRCCAEVGWLVQRLGGPDLRHRFDETMTSVTRTLAQRPVVRAPDLRAS